ncbi:hypothetical protein [Nocardiopsis ganjiahuensis]|uniref:hypothetical protein n=1 Tax=Nocardiopsis ganjiahuensis TaxID=239984 RepID=UPI000349FA0A|nr:hypothetical protein [Nocardiopsis ganjiahuensis]
MITTFDILMLAGLVLMGLAAGFFLAVSIGIRRQDNRGSYRSLRQDDDDSALSRTGRGLVGLRFREDRRELPVQSRTPTAV